MDIKNVLVSGLVAIVAVVVGVTFMKPAGTVEYRDIPEENLGATPGNVVEGNYFTVGGVEMAYLSGSFASTTNVCLFKNPFPSASTTITRFTAIGTSPYVGSANVKIALATSTLATPHGATAGVGTSTTQLFNEITVTAAKGFEVVWSPETYLPQANSTGYSILSPGHTLALRVATSNNAVNVSGKQMRTRCTATFQKL